ncbi:hypothetical protein KAFR_0B01200 [Kazachstania africana CBS 2517]|uniref:NADP-dependent oxidoreductase domain-containing protein n=1 Tax=Kazachstania africana (strain ATCC 22294 / BCRC 22015 / CBS 2517 / CECT 1963 / NBRC 1671 / NRRL Y-8276) TaxID=1071382 RepID=H2APW9_KAZAF|nr:hypothetical protein KAFR_0B01200 [Kazachstania africana CBS 2517]CCF56419.1 hypothetical protein KAFR_0B01200 [Kazachstania africana CBS 2517]
MLGFKQEFTTLNNGNKMPSIAIIGTGTAWYKTEETPETFSQELVDQIKYALTLPGIVHIDAAEVYRTYPEVGKALRESHNVKPRDEIFITDKYSTQLKISENPMVGLTNGLKKLGLDYVDLYLLHSPFISKEKNGFTMEEAWKYMEDLYKAGKVKNIGVSNFSMADLQRILKSCEVKPQVNQIEFNAFLQNQTPGIVNFCRENDIQVVAYTPLGPLQRKSKNFEQENFHKFVKQLAEKYDKSEAQILLRWVSKRGIIPVTTSSKEKRIKDAQYLFTFDLTDSEVEKITQLGLKHEPQRMYWNDQYDKFNSQSQKI